MTKPGEGVASRLRRFFEANPDEELTYAQVVEKFDASTHNARDAVKDLSKAGLLESVHIIRLRTKGIAK